MPSKELLRFGRISRDYRAVSVAYAWLVILIAIFAVMIGYIATYDVVATLTNIALDMGIPQDYLDKLTKGYYLFPVPFLIALIIYGIASAIRREGDTYR